MSSYPTLNTSQGSDPWKLQPLWRGTTVFFPLNFCHLPCSRNGACTRSKWAQLSELTQWQSQKRRADPAALKRRSSGCHNSHPSLANQQPRAKLLQSWTQRTLYLLGGSQGNLSVGSGSHQNNAAYIWSSLKLKQNLNLMQSNYSSVGKQALKWTAHKGALLWRKNIQFFINKSFFSHFPF